MLKKLFIAGALLATTACGDNTKKYKAEITEHKAKVEAGLKIIDKRLKECATPSEDVTNLKANFNLEEFKENWIAPLNDYINSDKITEEDYKDFSSQKFGASKYFSSFYTVLENSKC